MLATATTTQRAAGRTKHASASAATRRLSKTQIHPLGDRVVIQPSAHEEMTKSGIVIPDTAKEKPQEGTILAVGPGRILDDRGLGLAVASGATAIATDARSRLDTLRRLALDNGQVWAAR